jgi:hypothetical protein
MPVRPTTGMPLSNDEWFYQLYFQKPGVAEAELERDVRATIRTILYSLSGDGPPGTHDMVPRGKGVLSRLSNPSELPRWLSDPDIDLYEGEFKHGFSRGPQLVPQD